MHKAVAFALFAVACSGDRKSTQITQLAPPPDAAAVAVVPHHAPPTCPFPATPPADEEGHGGEGEARVESGKGNTCATADDNLTRTADAILARKPVAPIAAKPWDKRNPPLYDTLVGNRLGLSRDERLVLAKNGFVVLDRHPYQSYAYAFHEVYQSELPLFVSVDAVLHAVYQGNDSLIAELEDKQLAPQLAELLDALACTLPAVANYPADARRDLDLYLAVARALYRGDAPVSMSGDPTVEAEAKQLVDRAIAAAAMTTVPLFGRDRVIDFTAYTPRSHYAKTEPRQRYFRAAMWLSRLEFNLVSRSSRSSQPGEVADPSETPREVVLALALADLVERAGKAAPLAKLDTAWALLAGRREDVSMAQLGALRKQAGVQSLTDPDAAKRVMAAIGDKFQRTARLHCMPQGTPKLPAIATFLGPRVVPDAAATKPIVSDAVPQREVLHAADMGYVLGHDRALAYLAEDRKQFPTLETQLGVARKVAATTPRGTDDLYSAWLDAVSGLATPITGVRPSFAQTPAYADLHLASALLGFGQIKHNYVLVAGESYFAGGCEIPDGYVEPAPAMYAALIDYAKRGEQAMAALDPSDAIGAKAYFARLGRVLRVLSAIVDDELAGRPLSTDEKAFLSMVSEMAAGTTGGPPTYTGWWFDMFRNRTEDGLADTDFIASFFTGSKISYIGAGAPRLGVFVIDTNGAPRLAVGPVGHAYEYTGPVAKRVDDAAARDLPPAEKLSPWEASYVVAAPPQPKLSVLWDVGGDSPVRAFSPERLTVTFEPYDHHRKALTKIVKTLPANKVLKFKLPKTRKAIEGIHIVVGGFHTWVDVEIVGGFLGTNLGGTSIPTDDPSN